MRLFVGLLAAVLSIPAVARDPSQDSQQPYRPSKLEWLVLNLNASYRTPCYLRLPDPHFCIGYSFVENQPNNVLVLFELRGDVPPSQYDATVEKIRDVVRIEASKLKVPVEVTFRKLAKN
jgi:hypothetical protein